MFKLAANKIIHSRDLIWLDQMYGTYKALTTRAVMMMQPILRPHQRRCRKGRLASNNAPVIDPVDDDEEMPGLIVDQEKMNQFQT